MNHTDLTNGKRGLADIIVKKSFNILQLEKEKRKILDSYESFE